MESLYAWNTQKNLTRIPREEAWRRHIIDSLLFHDLIPKNSTVLDLGTGPGFPAWPLAWARPDLRVTAMDSNGKMLEFLRSRDMPSLTILQVRAEDWGVRERFDVVTGRALAPLPAQLELSAATIRIGGLAIPMRTVNDDPEAVKYAELGLELTQVVDRALPGTDEMRRFPVYTKVAATPKKYPRRWAEIKLKPLV